MKRLHDSKATSQRGSCLAGLAIQERSALPKAFLSAPRQSTLIPLIYSLSSELLLIGALYNEFTW